MLLTNQTDQSIHLKRMYIKFPYFSLYILIICLLLSVNALSQEVNPQSKEVNSQSYFSQIKKISIEKGHSKALLVSGHLYKNKKIKSLYNDLNNKYSQKKSTSNLWSSHYKYVIKQEEYGKIHFNNPSNNARTILTNTLGCMEYQVSSLFSISNSDLPYIAAVTGITLGLIAVDPNLDRSVTKLKDKSNVIDQTSDFITEFGGSKGVYTVAAFTGLSILTKSSKGLQTSLYAFEAMLTSGLWVRLGKLLAGRERPSAAYEYSKHPGGIWRGPIHQITNEEKRSVASYDAFPSGHTATIFSIATVFAEQYKDIPIVPIFCYSFASLVGISRMLEHTHWASDVFLGGVIGYLSGKATLSFYKPKTNKVEKKSVTFSIKPVISTISYGANVDINF